MRLGVLLTALLLAPAALSHEDPACYSLEHGFAACKPKPPKITSGEGQLPAECRQVELRVYDITTGKFYPQVVYDAETQPQAVRLYCDTPSFMRPFWRCLDDTGYPVTGWSVLGDWLRCD